MKYLIIMTIVWAFSFPLIGYYLIGYVDIYFAILMRFALALIVFLPFIRFSGIKHSLKLKLMSIGAIQIGIMYLFYYSSFKYLKISEVALFTIFTPFYVSLFYDICAKKFRSLYLISISIAVFGAYIIRKGDIDSDFIIGFLLVQGANICFGAGQSFYKSVIESINSSTNNQIKQENIFGYFYIGAFIVGLLSFLINGDVQKLPNTATQWAILLYLGIIASGVGYFMWNKGASIVDSGVLAIMNNALIPAAILVDLIIWSKNADILKLIIGGGLIGFSLWLHYRIIRFYNAKSLKVYKK